MATRTVSVSVRMNLAGFLGQARLGTKAIGDMHKEARKLAREGALDAFASRAAIAAGGLVLALGAVIKTTAEFEAAMSKVAAATGAAGDELNGLRDAALEAGRTTAYSATQAAGAITELSKAGLSTTDILGGGLAGALSLAAAGELEVAEAAEIAATAMVQFGLSGSQIPHVADLLAAGAGKAQGDVQDLAMALKQGGLVASQMGLSIEETTGTLAAFASAGLLGSDAGTSFKTMLLRLAAPAGEAADLMKSLGIHAYDTSGQFVGMVDFAGQLKTSLGGLTQAQRDSALATIFGADAIRAANVLYMQGSEGIQEWITKVDDAGFAEEQAAKKMDNLIGDLKKLRGAIESGLIESGTSANNALRSLVQTGTTVTNWLSSMPPFLQQAAVWGAALAASGLLITAGWVKAIETLGAARVALEGMGTFGERAGKGLGWMTRAGGWALAFGVGLAASGVAATTLGGALSDLLGNKTLELVEHDIDMLTISLQEFAVTGKAAGTLSDIFGKDLGGLAVAADMLDEAAAKTAEMREDLAQADAASRAALDSASIYGDAVYELAASDAAAQFQALDTALTQLAANGGPHQAAFAQLAARAQTMGLSTGELLALMPQYAAAANGAALANSGLAEGFGTAEGNAKLMAEGMDLAMQAGRSLADILNELHGAALGFARAEITAEDAVDTFRSALEASEGSLNTNTEKGRAAASAMYDLIEAAVAAADAKAKEGGSVKEVTKVYDDYIKQLRQMLIDMGMEEEAVDALLAAYAELPDTVFTEIKNTAKTADDKVQDYLDSLGDIPKHKKTLIEIQYKSINSKRQGVDEAFGRADGAVVDYYARGGIRENHVAQIAPAGSMRIWAEPETGGEAYIPMAMSKRARSLKILGEVARRFGVLDAMSGTGGTSGTYIENVHVSAYSDRFSLPQFIQELAMQGAV